MNTPRLITDTDGVTVWTWDGEAFGNTPPNSNPSGLGNLTFNLRFPGQYYDAETNLNQNTYRDYDPNNGRYVESDPIGLDGGQFSTFGYVSGNPFSFSDPMGLCPPGTHTATLDEIGMITNAMQNLAGKGLSYGDIKCNQFVDRAINAAFPGALSSEYNTTQMKNGQGPFQQAMTPSVGDLALLSSPGHVVYITGVVNGKVTQFMGSQTSTGPATVNLPNPYYWSPKFDMPNNVIYLQICLPD